MRETGLRGILRLAFFFCFWMFFKDVLGMDHRSVDGSKACVQRAAQVLAAQRIWFRLGEIALYGKLGCTPTYSISTCGATRTHVNKIAETRLAGTNFNSGIESMPATIGT